MTELTLGAQGRLDEYVNELRRVLSGSPAVDPAEVERDVRDHIDAALAGHVGPVDAPVLDDILRKLGSPAQWLPEGEPAWFRRSPIHWPGHFKQVTLRLGRHLAGGPESYRLAYLSLLVLSAGWFFMPHDRIDEAIRVPVLATLVSFILARAALALFGAKRLTGGQKWLLYPSLLAVYLPVAAIVLIGPVALAGGIALKSVSQFDSDRQDLHGEVAYLNSWIKKDTTELQQAEMPGTAPAARSVDEIKKDLAERVSRREAKVRELEEYPQRPKLWDVSLTPGVMIFGLIAVAGATWFFVGLFCTLFPSAVRSVFHPFADGFSHQMGFGLAVLGLFMSFGGLVVLK
jgi:outer membrane murein-binding lipoprotein Lpp